MYASLDGKMAEAHDEYNSAIIIKLYQDVIDDDGKTLKIQSLIRQIQNKAEGDRTELERKKRHELGLMEATLDDNEKVVVTNEQTAEIVKTIQRKERERRKVE